MGLNVKNANYQLVLSAVVKRLKEKYADACDCPRCIGDMAAYALNLLPPHYYVETDADKDEEFGSPWVMVEYAVCEAIEGVMAKPNHPQALERRVHGRRCAVAGTEKEQGGEKEQDRAMGVVKENRKESRR